MITSTMLSVTNTFAAIRKLGLTVSRTDGEWRINFPKHGEDAAYYTDDNADALATAETMAACHDSAVCLNCLSHR